MTKALYDKSLNNFLNKLMITENTMSEENIHLYQYIWAKVILKALAATMTLEGSY